MFNNLRRPAPSKAALKVLYQLAYISSGTAVGIATLCTEERRRQAQIVQKIADNAKRIRQSPRHVHNVARARRHEEEEAARSEVTREVEREKIEREQDLRRSARDPDLPSAVEGVYEQLVSRDYKRRRRQPTVQAYSNPSVVHRGVNLPEDFEKKHQDHGNGVVRRVAVPQALSRVYTRPPDSDLLTFAEEREEHLEEKMPAHFRQLLKRDQDAFSSNYSKSATPQSVARDTLLFFRQEPWSSSGITEAKIARGLSFDAIECGTWTEIRSLYRWLLARRALHSSHITALCDACGDLTEAADHFELFELYEAIFSMECFQRLATGDRFRCFAKVADAALDWDLDIDLPSRMSRILKHIFPRLTRREVFAVATGYCEHFLATNDPLRADRLMNILSCAWHLDAKQWLRSMKNSEAWTSLQGRVFSSALEHGYHSLAARVLSRELRSRNDQYDIPHLESFSVTCGRRQSYAALSSIARHRGLSDYIQDCLPRLSDIAKVAIAHACCLVSDRPHALDLFEKIYSTLPVNLREGLGQIWTTTHLQDRWRRTRSLTGVFKLYTSAKRLAFDEGAAELLVSADTTLIDILNAANRPRQALQHLEAMNRRVPHSSRSLSLAALSLAKEGAWSRLEKLLALLGESGSFVQDGAVSKCFNTIIQLFARRHTAAETWKFVTDLMENLRFVPTRITTETVLQAFVRERHLPFISHWIRHLRTMGHVFEMDAKTAANLVNTYYLEQRPPHVLVMWFCRQITILSPSLDPSEFTRVITEAIGWDVRTGKRAVRKKAGKDLFLLQQSSTGIIPKPVHRSQELPSDSDALEVPQAKTKSALEPSAQDHDSEPMWRESASAVDEAMRRYTPHFLEQAQQSVDQATIAGAKFKPSQPPRGKSTEEEFVNLLHNFNSADDIEVDCADPVALVQGPPDHVEQTDFFGLGLENAKGAIHPHNDTLLDVENALKPEIRDESRREVERQMVLAFSLGQYDEVLELYYSSCFPRGLPISPRALEITAEASLRLRGGDQTEIDGIIEEARNTGMNISCAQGPILLHQMRHLDPHNKRDANKLRLMAMEYYRSNEANGWKVSNHLVVMAAKILINNHRAEYGINLLSDLSQSKWVEEHPLDIVAMTVFLQGYAALRSEKGIKWTIGAVLRKNMRIDHRFLAAIKRCAIHFEMPNVAERVKPNARPNRLRSQLRVWRLMCSRRRMEQRRESKVFGRNMVKFIVKLSNRSRQPAIESEVRREVESQLFGDPLLQDPLTAKTTPPTNSTALRRARSRMARAIRWQVGPRHDGRRTADVMRNLVWLKQYRAFLRSDIVMPDGKLAAFRYRLANIPRRPMRDRKARAQDTRQDPSGTVG